LGLEPGGGLKKMILNLRGTRQRFAKESGMVGRVKKKGKKDRINIQGTSRRTRPAPRVLKEMGRADGRKS